MSHRGIEFSCCACKFTNALELLTLAMQTIASSGIMNVTGISMTLVRSPVERYCNVKLNRIAKWRHRFCFSDLPSTLFRVGTGSACGEFGTQKRCRGLHKPTGIHCQRGCEICLRNWRISRGLFRSSLDNLHVVLVLKIDSKNNQTSN